MGGLGISGRREWARGIVMGGALHVIVMLLMVVPMMSVVVVMQVPPTSAPHQGTAASPTTTVLHQLPYFRILVADVIGQFRLFETGRRHPLVPARPGGTRRRVGAV